MELTRKILIEKVESPFWYFNSPVQVPDFFWEQVSFDIGTSHSLIEETIEYIVCKILCPLLKSTDYYICESQMEFIVHIHPNIFRFNKTTLWGVIQLCSHEKYTNQFYVHGYILGMWQGTTRYPKYRVKIQND